MLKQYKKQFNAAFRILDLFFLILSFYVAYHLRHDFGEFSFLDLPTQYQVFLVVYLVSWIYLSNRFRLYASRRMSGFEYEAFVLVKTSTLCLIIATIPAFFVRENPLSRVFLLILYFLQLAILVSFRFVLRETLKYIRRQGYDYRQILIAGRNERADRLMERVEVFPEYGLRILGFIDAPNGKETSLRKLKFLGTLEELGDILRENVVDEVFVFLPIKSFYAKIEEIIKVCEDVGVEIKIPTDLFSIRLAKSKISLYGDLRVIDLYVSPKMSLQLFAKRLIDMIASAALLVLLSPLLGVVSALIKGTSRGPVLFRQQRVGYNGRLFDCLKFRTMYQNAEELKKGLLALNEMTGPVFKMKNDPRVTPVGRVLRKTSIDELPQLINVLLGDMSLVGPRPPVPSEVDQYNLKDRRRLSMKPGITCLWQVSGRNLIPFKEWMELDRQYIDRWSLWLDLKILVRTVSAVIRGQGAA